MQGMGTIAKTLRELGAYKEGNVYRIPKGKK
jgi:hypothetical protein